ncbi:3533_t:CDS:2, partial [Funneliformis geosporum]
DTIKSDISKLFKEYQEKIKKILQDVSGKISFTIDGWTSPNILSFLGITCHYIDADWKVQNILLDFVSLSGPHSGENIANAFSKCLQEMNLLTK